MTKKHGHHQSGEPLGQEKNEGMKNFSTEDEMKNKKVVDLRGGDNAQMSEKDWDEFEHQQAGGSHKGGMVSGAHGEEQRDNQAN